MKETFNLTYLGLFPLGRSPSGKGMGIKMNFIGLSDSELEVMEVLWKKDEPMTFGELLNYFNIHTEKSWKKQTLNTFLFRMQQKNLVQIIVEGKHKLYIPALTKEEYLLKESKAFLNKNYQGSIVKMIAAFNGSEELEKDEIDRLKQLLERWGKE